MTEYRIKKLKPKNKRAERYVLEFEPEREKIELAAVVVSSSRLVKDAKVSEELLTQLLQDDERERCRLAAWRLLALKPRAVGELRTALKQRKFLAKSIGQVLSRLEEMGYVDDKQYARLFTESKSQSRKNGPKLVYQQLRAKGVDAELAAQSADKLREGDYQEESVRKLLEKWNKRKNPEDPQKRKTAAAGYLMRRGFDPNVVWEEVRAFFDDEDQTY